MTMRLRESLLMRPADITSSQVGWEVIGVLNPAVTRVGDDVVMLARVAERSAEKRPGQTSLPRWQGDGTATVDWFNDVDLQLNDSRVVVVKNSGDLRLTSVSHLQVLSRSADSDGPWKAKSFILPAGEFEEYGIEDPRITLIDDTYWITYVAVSKLGACTGLMSTLDMKTFQRHGIIFASENKDVVLFPKRIDGDYVALHRPNPNSHFSPPSIWLARSLDMIYWGRHQPLVSGHESWEGDRIGSGPPPIRVDQGWLLLYHGSERTRVVGGVGQYTAGALLLDLNDPSRVVARSTAPIMKPTASFETSGFVPNVVFPTAMLDHGDTLEVFYGAADTCIATAEFSKREILDSMILTNGSPR